MSKTVMLYNYTVILHYSCEYISPADFGEHFKLWSRVHLKDPQAPFLIDTDIDSQLPKSRKPLIQHHRHPFSHVMKLPAQPFPFQGVASHRRQGGLHGKRMAPPTIVRHKPSGRRHLGHHPRNDPSAMRLLQQNSQIKGGTAVKHELNPLLNQVTLPGGKTGFDNSR